MTPLLRPLRWWELDVVAAADARIFGATAWTLGYYWAVMAQPGTEMIVAELDAAAGELSAESLAGWIVMSSAGQEADVMTIATTERARGQGVGRAVLTAGLDWARSRGARTVHLEVDSSNPAAIGLYESFGFTEWGRRPDYYPGSDALLMRLTTTE
ncbi:ribosomal-protein-alanine N-acetyltransferase [Brevibacterium sanguinis]|uniref:Ribosomal-protein-alanine N-acetyltransferase n=2 Tax=Brevibacterium TaxID=1696 RepID=A0A366IMX5_9MICO|nr:MULTISPECIES: GNAT family N-acetyltransferase [Brevibacterium]RBP68168.1 ribosomal-protein-alanine N-acetyltransferase [Brevibacterium sanguinis]RBP74415.1 ribosomal-protein-alanine N-acetyltransferase [Brevibacterium celere]